MINQRKYIIRAFLIFSVLFVGFYFVSGLVQEGGRKSDVVQIDLVETNQGTSVQYENGKTLFQSRCASCHSVNRDLTGPALQGVTERGPWIDSLKLFTYIRNPESLRNDKYVIGLKKEFGFNHIGFPDLTDDQIRSILNYIKAYQRPVVFF